MKKRFAAPLAAVLAMSMAFSSLAAVKLDTPVVRWSSEREALPEWKRVENASQSPLERHRGMLGRAGNSGRI